MRLTKDRVTAILMILPSLVLLAVFVYGFIRRTAYVSLTNWGQDPSQALALEPKLEFVGLANYVNLFTSALESRFRQDLVNTFFFTIFFLVGCLVIGLGLRNNEILTAKPFAAPLVALDEIGGALGGYEPALAVTATSYHSGRSFTFIQGRAGHPVWLKSRRVTLPVTINTGISRNPGT